MDTTDVLGSSAGGDSSTGLKEGDIIINRFKLIKKLGEGGMGIVWEAEDKFLSVKVALKFFLKANLSSKKLQRIKREVLKGRELSNKNLLRYYEVFEDEKYLFFSMELIKGKTLSEAIKERDFKEEDIKDFLKQIVDALNYIHSQGIIHRDIKPSNIFIKEEGIFILGDLGILYLDEEGSLTGTKEIIGTLHYIPPEAFDRKFSPSYDYYSLGITLYEIVSGQLPFDGTDAEIMKGHQFKEPPRIKNKISRYLKRLIYGLLIKNPEKRWGNKEIKKYIEEKKLPFLPREMKNFAFLTFFLLLLISIIYFSPKFLAPEPESVEFKGSKLKVFSKKGLLLEKEMEREISDAKVMDWNKNKEKEIIVSYQIKPDCFEGKKDTDLTLISDILNSKGIRIFSPIIGNLPFYRNFSKFSFNYANHIFPLIEIENGKILPVRNFYFNIRHTFFPNIIYLFKNSIDSKDYFYLSSEGFVQGICLWDDKLVAIGYANTLLHQCYILCLKDYRIGFDLGDILNINTNNIKGLHLLGRKELLNRTIDFSPEDENLRIGLTYKEKEYIMDKKGNLLGFKENTPEMTVSLIENYAKVRNFINENELKKAKQLISDNIEKSEEYNLLGYTVLFISLKAEIEFIEGNIEDSINLCLDSAKKYDGYGNDLYGKAAFLAYLNAEYNKAIKFWNEDPSFGQAGFLEKKSFQIFALLLGENWKKAEELFGLEISQGINIWNNYINYQRGIMYLLRKNIDEAIKILKPAIDDLNMEDLGTFYFLAKICKGEPDIENFEKYIKNYPMGPLYLQFSGACTKGEWGNARLLYYQMEKASVHDPGVALIFPVIKKITKIYPEKFKL